MSGKPGSRGVGEAGAGLGISRRALQKHLFVIGMAADQIVDAGPRFRIQTVVGDGGDEAVPGGVPGGKSGRERQQERNRCGNKTRAAHDGLSSITLSAVPPFALSVFKSVEEA